jgi:hypothetical protein
VVALAEIAVVSVFFFTSSKSSPRWQLWYDNGSISGGARKKPKYKRTSDVSKGGTKVVSLQCPEPAA